jgi:DNA-directed RNA polymerase specialized sigma24 family protein
MRQSVEVRMVRLEPAARDDVHLVDDHDQLDRGFRKLKPGQRAAVVLHFYLGLSVPEVADALGVPVGTAKSRIHYAVDAMRAALEADERTPIATTGGLTQ